MFHQVIINVVVIDKRYIRVGRRGAAATRPSVVICDTVNQSEIHHIKVFKNYLEDQQMNSMHAGITCMLVM